VDFFSLTAIAIVILLILRAFLKKGEAGPLRKKDPNELYEIAHELEVVSQNAAHPKEILQIPPFKRGVDHLNSHDYSTKDLLTYYTGNNPYLPWIALEALARRKKDDNDILEPILQGINIGSYWTRFFALRTLQKRYETPIVATVLTRLDDTWLDVIPIQLLQEFISDRLAAGEKPQFGELLNNISAGQIGFLERILPKLGSNLVGSLINEIQEWRRTTVDINFLRTFGKIWDATDAEMDEIVIHDQLSSDVSKIEATISEYPPQSIILVGDAGAGKSTLLDVLAQRLLNKGWIIFEAGGPDILSGQIYIGELEGRLKKLMENIADKGNILWVVPNFHNLLWAGQHRYSPSGILDFILPYVERGQIVLIGETRPGGYERLMQTRSKLNAIFDTNRINPMSYADALDLAQQWATKRSKKTKSDLISRDTLDEAAQLTQQYLGEMSLPGSLLQFLKLTLRRLTAFDEKASVTITRDDLLLTLSHLTGLPKNILDDRQGLDLQGLRDFFHERVLGQEEAIDCLVERVAMIKSGLTDPTRPQGVFLFVGPTGTGKTEIAKTLTEFLFGSQERMIRLDMSEFQTVESLDRILGEKEEMQNNALVNLIRNQPFSVILLDEFEKAHYNIWDLFLQVFDDGRLTDRRGNTADFRHSIIILTSNLGSNIPLGVSIGFSKDSPTFTASSVEREVGRVFRKEFLNRLDRTIVFRPLGTGTMREILHKELQEVLNRRGLRTRNWAVVWDDSAIDFLLHKGFTPDLGARPLKRAIERYLLSPLSITIVNHQFPEGDQFLLVRSDGQKIVVDFIDPDAPDDKATSPTAPPEEAAGDKEKFHVKNIMLNPQGTFAEAEFLRENIIALEELIEGEEWQKMKAVALSATSSPGFWDSPERFSILGKAEYMDRIETGLNTGKSLVRRLMGSQPDEREHFSRQLARRLAQQIYLVEAAYSGLIEERPREAFVLVEGIREGKSSIPKTNEFASQIGNMYRQWASKRKMRLEILRETEMDSKEPYQLLLSVVGFAAFTILEQETGLHILEIPQEGKKSFHRYKVRVRVIAQPEAPADHGVDGLRNQALKAFSDFEDDGLKIVRRYREEPSPLIRDSIKNWRTGNWEQVLGGDFDLVL
jgi:ATP-dependent Clp protease ATP-binding subunit ClpC